jgi:hypothetical protein
MKLFVITLLACGLCELSAESKAPNTKLVHDFFAALEKHPDPVPLRRNLRGPEPSPGEWVVDQSKLLVWAAFTKEFGLLIFDPGSQSWPGSQPVTVVLTDADLSVLDWIEIGGSPVFRSAELDESSSQLTVTFRQRSGGAYIQSVQVRAEKLELVDSKSAPDLNLGVFLYEEKIVQPTSGANEPRRSAP